MQVPGIHASMNVSFRGMRFLSTFMSNLKGKIESIQEFSKGMHAIANFQQGVGLM